MLAGVIFLFIKSVVTKLFTLGLVVLAMIFVIAIGSDTLSYLVKPLVINENEVQVYEGNVPVRFDTSEVRSVTVVNNPEGRGVKISFVVGEKVYDTVVSTFVYEWSIKRVVHKVFSGRLYDIAY